MGEMNVRELNMLLSVATRTTNLYGRKAKNIYDDALKKVIQSKIPATYPKYINIYRKKDGHNFVYNDGEYFMSNIRKLLNTDSYSRLMVDKYTILILSQGFDITGQSHGAVKYIKNRLDEIERVSMKLIDELIEIITNNLLGYSNAFVYINRDKNASTGRVRYDKLLKKKLDPISTLEIIDLKSNDVSIYADDFGNAKFYEQYIDGKKVKEFKADDIIHLKIFPGKIWGMPVLSNVYEDIMMLRRIEDNMILQCFQHAVPPMLYKVPAANDGNGIIAEDPNVIHGKNELEAMLAHGGLVTTSDSELSMPTPGNTMDMTKYLNYAKLRVLAGLRLPQIATGDGSTANKSTAGFVTNEMISQAKYIQKVIARVFDKFIINELLKESKVKYIRNKVNEVHLHFPEIDIASMTSINNHYMALWNAGLVTRTEARSRMGMSPLKKSDIEDTVFKISPKYDPEDSMDPNNTPENQYGKKMTAAPNTAANDENQQQQNNATVYFSNILAQFQEYIQNSRLKAEVKDKIITTIRHRIELINDANSDDAKTYMYAKLQELISNLSKAVGNYQFRDNITDDQIAAYVDSVIHND